MREEERERREVMVGGRVVGEMYDPGVVGGRVGEGGIGGRG